MRPRRTLMQSQIKQFKKRFVIFFKDKLYYR
eukprot:UN21573